MWFGHRELIQQDLKYHLQQIHHSYATITPAVYDTAQVLRLLPSIPPWKGLDWLLAQQESDGGWGQIEDTRGRTVPTLAAVLTLLVRSRRAADTAAAWRGINWLHRSLLAWREPLGDDLPVGIELVLPALLDVAAEVGLDVGGPVFDDLRALGARRRAIIERLHVRPGTSAVHSWEAWGITPDPQFLDKIGSVGHSPAATAAWLAIAEQAGTHPNDVSRAYAYLESATHATGLELPGVVPTVWPIAHFVEAFSLHALLMAGVFSHAALQDEVRVALQRLQRSCTADGIGFTDYFEPDGDTSGVTLAVMMAAGLPIPGDPLSHFLADRPNAVTYPFELQPSITTTAHVLHALALGHDPRAEHLAAWLLKRQQLDGRWYGDKWNQSWLYTSSHVAAALAACNYRTESALTHLLASLAVMQHPDGGWGEHSPTPEETAYALLALRACKVAGVGGTTIPAIAARGAEWLAAQYRPFDDTIERKAWIGKEGYRPRRLVRIIMLAALLNHAECVERSEVL